MSESTVAGLTRCRNTRRGALGSLLLLALSGCSSYQLGTASLFPTSIQTIYIPVVRSDSFRPDLGVRLTEAIQKRVEERTQYKIVDDVVADSQLVCRLTTDSKRVVTETRTDEPRQLKSFFTVESSWTDRQGNVLMENRFLPPGETAFYFAQGADFVPEAGQSLSTAQQRAIERLADHIVDQMESRW